ncbi:ATP-binding cassette domain-containing protein [Agromyces sp. CFH 90414]|uniref:ATP-binding cassette domain-containing protein n=1 Tax=Agromyces agglutinans TaxID=2662258 RepID=A0A6I2F3Z1_9MICO|nr:ATP-binding cassette domain-containing protein [Agromyces agglutinans]MRG60195.1 ATP-binding cassette domain-containing protein [Agromyces agglutinans]
MTRSALSARLSLRAATKRFADRVVLDRVDLATRPGEHVGVIGDNGSGKSTLLRLLAGAIEPDAGEVSIFAPGGLALLEQVVELPESGPRPPTVHDAIDACSRDLRALERDLRAAEAALAGPGGDGLEGAALDEGLRRYAGLLDRYEARDGYGASARLDAALEVLGVGGIDRDRPWSTLSGGERSRVALAATVAANAEVLLLDEPTNDLDDDAWDWLVAALRAHRGTVVAVTHDRAFLDAFTDVVWEVDRGRVARHGDGYRGFLRAKAAERERQRLAHEAWTEELSRHRALVAANAFRLDAIPRKAEKAGFGHGAFRLRGRDHGAMGRIRNAKERVARLLDEPVAPPPEPLRFSATLARAAADPANETAMDAPAPPLLELVGARVAGVEVGDLRLEAGDRVLVTGPNGVGKTSLLRAIEGTAPLEAGSVHVGGRVGHLRQQTSPAGAATTALEAFAAGIRDDLGTARDRLLRLGLFRGPELGVPVAALSYGQRRRLELALLVSRPHDVLLLDEPTNHLSPDLVDDLEHALESFDGAVVLVTHDRRMRERFSGRRVRMERAAA